MANSQAPSTTVRGTTAVIISREDCRRWRIWPLDASGEPTGLVEERKVVLALPGNGNGYPSKE